MSSLSERRGLWAPTLMIAGTTLLASCGGPAPSSMTPSTALDSPAPVSITLRSVPPNFACDAVPVDYRSVTFAIDPAGAEAVAAVTDGGRPLSTYWADGFTGGDDTHRVVYDPEGQVVVSDGDRLAIPNGAWPSLQQYFVCPTQDALYVLIEPR